MTTRRPDRRRYQAEVARLLELIDTQSSRLRLLEASGARPPALEPLEREAERTRRQLAAVVGSRREELRAAA